MHILKGICITIFFVIQKIVAFSLLFPNTRQTNNRRNQQSRPLHQEKGYNDVECEPIDAPTGIAPPFDIKVIESTIGFNRDEFVATNCWSTLPLLIRGAFRNESVTLLHQDIMESSSQEDLNDDEMIEIEDNDNSWPTWDEMINLSMDEDIESRLITHQLDSSNTTTTNVVDHNSWEMELGPFDAHDLRNVEQSAKKMWTLVLNDVDRFHPALFDWISETFSFIPNWRRDDGQISLSNQGGGIGPHVDDYDVFLIQMSGQRRWDVGRRLISNKEELEGLIEDLDIRVLNFWDDEVEKGYVNSFVLNPGDVLYLPPRVAHCGTALLDRSMTLSVGLRAPSAKELITRLTESISDMTDGNVVKRYRDPSLLNTRNVDSQITPKVKNETKEMLKDALLSLVDDEHYFDQLLGRLLTESKRSRFNYPVPLDEYDGGTRKQMGVWGNAKSSVETMLQGKGTLYAAEGITWAYSETKASGCNISRLFANGEVWEVEVTDTDHFSPAIVRHLVNERQFTRENLISLSRDEITETVPARIIELIEDLVQKGFLYGTDD